MGGSLCGQVRNLASEKNPPWGATGRKGRSGLQGVRSIQPPFYDSEPGRHPEHPPIRETRHDGSPCCPSSSLHLAASTSAQPAPPPGSLLGLPLAGSGPPLSPSFHGRPLPSRPRSHWVEILGYVPPGRVGMKQTPLFGTPPHHFSVPGDP